MRPMKCGPLTDKSAYLRYYSDSSQPSLHNNCCRTGSCPARLVAKVVALVTEESVLNLNQQSHLVTLAP